MKNCSNTRRRLLLSLVFMILASATASAQFAAKSLKAQNGTTIGFYEYKPKDYKSSTKYPLIIFLHGIGERGNGGSDLPKVKKIAIPKYIDRGHPMRFFWNGKWETFLVLVPQLSTSYGSWPAFYVEEMINHAKANLSIDENRIILTGLSLGGGGVWTYSSSNAKNAGQLAAIAPVCGTCNMNNASAITGAKLPVWAFHASDDNVVTVNCTHSAIDKLNALNPALAPIKTIYGSGKHNIWDMAYDTTYKRQNPNVFEWFLAQNKTLPANKQPKANAGKDLSVSINKELTLDASLSSDADGKILRYNWRLIDGPASAKITDPGKSLTTVNGFTKKGNYRFELQVIDDRASWHYDTVLVEAVETIFNKLPRAIPGKPQELKLPVDSTVLDGSASYDEDGAIKSYHWKKLSGPNAKIESPAGPKTKISGLSAGQYTFQLTVTDDKDGSHSDNIAITVHAAENIPPVALAGPDREIQLPVDNLRLDGSKSYDPDGRIESYQWRMISNDGNYVIARPNESSSPLRHLQEGIYLIELSVRDDAGAIAKDSLVVKVNPEPAKNKAPLANAGEDFSVRLPVGIVRLDGSLSQDTDGDIIRYTWKLLSGPGAVLIKTPNAASSPITNLIAGDYYFELEVEDNEGALAKDSVRISVLPALNKAPKANAGADQQIRLPEDQVELDGSKSSDEDGKIQSYQWTKISGPSIFNIENAKAAKTTVSGLSAGTYQFRLSVTDNSGASHSDDITVTVLPALNKAPKANAGADQQIRLPEDQVELDGSKSSDEDGKIQSYQWTKVSGPSIFNIENAKAAKTRVTGLSAGTYQFRLSVTDNSGASHSDDITVTVLPALNKAPKANAGADQQIRLPEDQVELDGSKSSDEDGKIQSYQWTKVSGPSTFKIENAKAAKTTVSGLSAGTYQFRLSVTDNSGASHSDDITITVLPALNKAPKANAGADQQIRLPEDQVELDGSKSSDEDGKIQSYQWTKVSGPSTFKIENAKAAKTRVSGLSAGTYQFRLSVTDNSGASHSDDITVTVLPALNKAPKANAGADQQIRLPEDQVELDGSKSSDEDGKIQSYQWTKVSGPSTFKIENAKAAKTRVSGLSAGTYQFRLSVTDNSGASHSDDITVTVLPALNKAPKANAGADRSLVLPLNYLVLNGKASSDADGRLVHFQWSKISGPDFYQIQRADSSETVVSKLVAGTYIFRLTVTDDQNARSSDDIQVKVEPASNRQPVAKAGSDSTILFPGGRIILDGTNSFDLDGKNLFFEWSVLKAPNAAAILDNKAAVTEVQNIMPGDYSFLLKVTDEQNAFAVDTVSFRVISNMRMENAMTVGPNPASNTIYINISSEAVGPVSLRIINLQGAHERSYSFDKQNPLLTRTIDISYLKAGLYIFELREISSGNRQVLKIIKR